jgi:hypothetical protein
MIPDDIDSTYALVVERQKHLGTAVQTAVHAACSDASELKQTVLAMLEKDSSSESIFRLMALPVHGALTGDIAPALPICVLSRLWWAGAELLDDVVDGEYDADAAEPPASAVIVAATACLTVLPQEVIALQQYSGALQIALERELNEATIRSADGQLLDAGRGIGTLAWQQTMTGYAGKTGAAYGRDAAMAALVAGCSGEELRGWRTFGRLFGVLRQMANDCAPENADSDADLMNGTPTLLLAYAMEILPRAEAEIMRRAHARAGRDARARTLVWERLRQPDVTVGYDHRIDGVRQRLSALLKLLAKPSSCRNLLQWMINVSADHARLTTQDRIAS